MSADCDQLQKLNERIAVLELALLQAINWIDLEQPALARIEAAKGLERHNETQSH